MSSIDQYLYTCIGGIECPTPYRLFAGQTNVQPIYIAIYHLEQDIPEYEEDFAGKAGDILVGGGSGEVPAMLIRIPDALIFYTDLEAIADLEHFLDKHAEIFKKFPVKIYWKPTEAYILGAGFETLGWNPEKQAIDRWLAEHVLAFLLEHYAEQFKVDGGYLDLDQDGSICRKITEEEDKMLNWKKYKYGSSS